MIAHDNNSADCPCGPELLKLCGECEGRGCVICSEGLVAASRFDSDHLGASVIIAHLPSDGSAERTANIQEAKRRIMAA